MAGVIDLGVLGYFSVIFAFLLIFVIMYGLLSWFKPFGEGQNGIYAIIAMAFAILSVVNQNILRMIYFMTPWFFILIFIGFIVMFGLMIFGWDMKTIAGRTTSTNFKTYAIIIVVVVVVFAIGTGFGQETLQEGQGQTANQDNTQNTDTQPQTTPEINTDPAQLPSIANNNPSTGTPEGTATENFGTNVLNTFVNPQVLGLILIMLIGAFAMFLITKTNID
ncbi:hypothetical protein K9L97_06010 [Candidatus Woesearchaeota archaeon]|nr:hypothetical protein [Candidatus Woesearchaeota archaeon]